jgi:formiminotetrahydrofolate cyclodeaminase
MIDRPFSAFLDDLAARTPTPGGGAASGFAAAMGLALFRMVFRFARGHAEPDRVGALDAVDVELGRLDRDVRRIAEDDAKAFGAVTEGYRLPKSTDAERAARRAAIQEGLVVAMAAPMTALERIRDVLAAAVPCRLDVRRDIAADLVNGAELLLAGAKGAWCNVAINASYLRDRARAETALDRAAVLMQQIRTAHDAIRRHGESFL